MSDDSPSSALADVSGPAPIPFYDLMLPLLECLFTPHEIEINKTWMQTERWKGQMVDALVYQVETLLAKNEYLEEAIQAGDAPSLELRKRGSELSDENPGFPSSPVTLYERYLSLQSQVEAMSMEIEMCRKHPIIVEKDYDQDVIVPQTTWMTEWRARPGFEKQAMFVQVIGESGLGRLPDIKARVAGRLGYSNPKAGSLSGAVDALVERGLLARRTAEAGMQGRPPKLVWLTNLGQAAYVFLTNKPPAHSELDTQASHVSDAHMLLNLVAAELLQANGYEILAHGHRHYLDGKRQAVPDLTARKDGQIVYIEVERSGKKSPRSEKWVNLCQLSCGNLFVFCQYPHSQRQIAREVQKDLLENGLSSRLRLTNLADLRYGLRGPEGGLWLEEMDIYPGLETDEDSENGLYD